MPSCAWQEAKAALNPGDAVRIITNNGSAELDLSKRIAEPRALLLARKLVNHSADMIFVVEMPDYQATGQWQLKHGGHADHRPFREPGTLLDKFYRRELDIRPGRRACAAASISRPPTAPIMKCSRSAIASSKSSRSCRPRVADAGAAPAIALPIPLTARPCRGARAAPPSRSSPVVLLRCNICLPADVNAPPHLGFTGALL